MQVVDEGGACSVGGKERGVTLEIEGFKIHTQLNEAMLKEISRLTDGAYFNAGSEAELLEIYNDIHSQLVIKPEKTEITSIFAGAGVLILIIGSALSLAWFNRLP